jgi:PleD family two-component response regulator
MTRTALPTEYCPSPIDPLVMVVGDLIPTRWRQHFLAHECAVVEANTVQKACALVQSVTPWVAVLSAQISGVAAAEVCGHIRAIATQHYMPIVCVVVTESDREDADSLDPHPVFDVVFRLDRGVAALMVEVMRLIRLTGEVRGHPRFVRTSRNVIHPASSSARERMPRRGRSERGRT